MLSNSNPKISVIIPCYNCSEWISDTIQSVLNQEYKNFEIIAVNDGSTDGTKNILENVSDHVLVIDQCNKGVSSARNKGVQNSIGEYIRFLDSDDVLPKDSLVKMVNVAINYPGNAVIGRSIVIDEDNNFTRNHDYNISYKGSTGSVVAYEYLITQATHSGIIMLPRHFFTNNKVRFNESLKLGEEYSLTLDSIKNDLEFRFCDDVVYRVRDHGGQRLSRSGSEEDYINVLNIIKENVSVLTEKSHIISNESRCKISKMLWSRGRFCIRNGFENAAVTMFDYAKIINPSSFISGNLFYRILLKFYGPFVAEKITMSLKRTIKN